MADYIRPTPRNPFLGGLADLLEASTSPERTQQMQGIMSMLGAPAVASTLNRMSYGAPLTSGAGGLGGTTRVLPDVLDAALAVAPVAPAAGQLAKRAVMATKGLPVGMGIKSVDDLMAKYPDVKIDASVNKNDINLSRIVVPKDMRNQGVGTQVMNDLSEYADSIGKRITLTPSSDFGGNAGKLKGFYKELGFVENKGRNKDFSTREAMYREPKPLGQTPSFQYPQEEAMQLAQQRAALPVEQYGLGLPAGNTAAQREAAMSGKRQVHFSRTGGDFTTLDSGQYAVAPFDAVGTHVGSKEAAQARFRNTTQTNDQRFNKGTTYPVSILGDRPLMNQAGMPWGEDELNAFLRQTGGHNWSDVNKGGMTYQDMNAALRKKLFDEQGYTSIPYVNEVEAKGSVSYIVPPENIRSINAAFDPFRRNAAIATATGALAPDLLAAQEDEAMRQRQLGLMGTIAP